MGLCLQQTSSEVKLLCDVNFLSARDWVVRPESVSNLSSSTDRRRRLTCEWVRAVGEGVVSAEEGDVAVLPVAELSVAIADEFLFSGERKPCHYQECDAVALILTVVRPIVLLCVCNPSHRTSVTISKRRKNSTHLLTILRPFVGTAKAPMEAKREAKIARKRTSRFIVDSAQVINTRRDYMFCKNSAPSD